MMMDSANGRRQSPRVLKFSQKNIFEHAVWRCPFNEFENIAQQVDAIEVLAPKPKPWYLTGKRAALNSGKFFAQPFNPGVEKVELARDYDLFFAVIEKPSELLNLKAVDFKKHCRKSICWLVEWYEYEIPEHKSCMEMLKEFDHVLYMYVNIEAFQRFVNYKGSYLPAGVDSLLFCPFPNPPERSIDVLSIGRRSEICHQILLKMMREEGIFYEYDTINSLAAYNLDQHRFMTSNRSKRSRYFIVNPGKVNRPEETGGQSEFGYRFFEAAAPGTIMVGQRPSPNKEFDRIFHWKDAVIEMAFDSDTIGQIIRELDQQPERQSEIRHANMLQCLLHHDWVYRWEEILKIAGLEPLPQMSQRKELLHEKAVMVEESRVRSQKVYR